MFKAPTLSHSDIMTAFENGDFYASSDPIIKELYAEDGDVVLKCETPLRYVRMVTGKQTVAIVRNRAKTPVFEARIKIIPIADTFVLKQKTLTTTVRIRMRTIFLI